MKSEEKIMLKRKLTRKVLFEKMDPSARVAKAFLDIWNSCKLIRFGNTESYSFFLIKGNDVYFELDRLHLRLFFTKHSLRSLMEIKLGPDERIGCRRKFLLIKRTIIEEISTSLKMDKGYKYNIQFQSGEGQDMINNLVLYSVAVSRDELYKKITKYR